MAEVIALQVLHTIIVQRWIPKIYLSRNKMKSSRSAAKYKWKFTNLSKTSGYYIFCVSRFPQKQTKDEHWDDKLQKNNQHELL